MLKTFILRHKFLLVVFLLFVFLRLPSLFEPYWYGDEGIYLVLGMAIRKGWTLYSQIHDNKPPSLYYLAAFAQTVFGFRLLLAFFMAGAIYYFHLLSTKLLAPKLVWFSTLIFTVVTSIPLFEGNIANAEVFMLLPTLSGIYYFLYSKSKLKYIFSGLLLGLAFTIKIPVAIEFGFLFVWYLFLYKNKLQSKIYDLIAFSVAFFIPFLAFLTYFSIKGAISEFMFSAILQNFGYLSSWQTGSHSGSAASGGLVTRGVILLLFWLLIYFASIKKIVDQKLSIIIFWFSAAIFGALLSTRPYPHYLIQILPSLSLMLIYLFEKNVKTSIKIFVLVLVFGLVGLFFKYKFYVYPVLSYYQNFYSHITSLSSSDYRNYFGSQVDDTYQISNYLIKNTATDEKIFIWGDEPYIYALSSRLPVGKFTVAYHIVDFNQFQAVSDQLKIYFPKIIIYYNQPGRNFPELERIISNYYHPVATIGKSTIYSQNK